MSNPDEREESRSGLLAALVGEGLGTAFLLMAVVGSGIMGADLSGGNVGLALLANSLATAFALYVLITTLGPISGAHFNPAVTLAFWMRGRISAKAATLYMVVQCLSAIFGVWLTHVMFNQDIIQVSAHERGGVSLWGSEVIATFGLVAFILFSVVLAPARVAAVVACYIGAAYWFTASTSFANPAVTLARMLTDTFTGIAPSCVMDSYQPRSWGHFWPPPSCSACDWARKMRLPVDLGSGFLRYTEQPMANWILIFLCLPAWILPSGLGVCLCSGMLHEGEVEVRSCCEDDERPKVEACCCSENQESETPIQRQHTEQESCCLTLICRSASCDRTTPEQADLEQLGQVMLRHTVQVVSVALVPLPVEAHTPQRPGPPGGALIPLRI